MKIIVSAIALTIVGLGALMIPGKLNQPTVDGIWLRPSSKSPAEPIIGFKDGIRIGLWPAQNGPRGLIRIYAPYVFPKGELSRINFIAIEPVVNGRRSFSELERSKLDILGGKRLWFVDDINDTSAPSRPWQCPRGKVGKIKVGSKEVRTLSIGIRVEKFESGAEPVILATFREDRPHEVTFKCYSTKSGATMESCVLTATMGNFARVRRLWLADEVIDSRKLWPNASGSDFFPVADYQQDRLHKDKDGSIIVAVTPDETDPASVKVSRNWWTCKASVATQYWRKPANSITEPFMARVNGRFIYYGTNTEIPGGVFYENFELISLFKPGIEFAFGVTPLTPEQMGWKVRKSD